MIAVFALAALWWHRDTRTRFSGLHVLPGFALVVVLVAPWLIAIWQVSDGGFFAEALGKDMGAKLTAGQEKHWGPPGLYLGLVWLTFWPWAALLPLAGGAVVCCGSGPDDLAWLVADRLDRAVLADPGGWCRRSCRTMCCRFTLRWRFWTGGLCRIRAGRGTALGQQLGGRAAR